MRLLRSSLVLATLALSLGLSPARAAEPALPLLRGVLLDGSGNLFCLADLTGAATWVKIGQTHEGWKLESFDADRQVLVLNRDGTKHEIALADTRITASELRASVADADKLLDEMRFEEMVAKSMEMQQKAMSRSMGQMLPKGASDADRAKFVEIQTKAMQIMLEEMDLPGMKKDVAKAMAEIYTAEEIRAQSAFYSTPVGRSATEKQPQLQARIAELMMPRVMKAMPKVQAMVMEASKPAPAPENAAP
jgi:hypothetical protein